MGVGVESVTRALHDKPWPLARVGGWGKGSWGLKRREQLENGTGKQAGEGGGGE